MGKTNSAPVAHTPGPWVVDLNSPLTLGGDTVSVDALTPDGKHVDREICTLMMDTDAYPNGKGWKTDAANARLIAAAPDLLAALEPFAELLFEREWPKGEVFRLEITAGDIYAAQDAIAKATGQQS